MSATLSLRIASVLTVIHAILHTVGGVFGHPRAGAQQAAALAMQTSPFQTMGLTRSYWDFHIGFGLAVGLMLLIEGIAFWQLSALARTVPRLLRPILTTFLVGYVALAAISWKFFFAAPLVTELLIALCLGMAIVAAGRVSKDEAN
jgi:hypothetical protein